MDNEILKIVELVKEKTDKELTVVSVGEADETVGYTRFRRGGRDYLCRVESDCDEGLKSLIVALLENVSLGDAPLGRVAALKSIVTGDANEITVQKYMRKYGVHDLPCAVFVVHTVDGKITDVLDFLDNFKTSPCDCSVITDETSCAYVRFQDGINTESEYKSLSDYADLLAQSLSEELGLNAKIGVGSLVSGFAESSVSYRQALSALRMGAIFEQNATVSTYKEYLLVKMLEDMPKYKLQEFLDILLEPESKAILSDPEMLTTAEEFLHTSLNVSETSRNLYMHRNTLMYRLDKIERATGLDIRKFQDAMTFRLVMILYKLIV